MDALGRDVTLVLAQRKPNSCFTQRSTEYTKGMDLSDLTVCLWPHATWVGQEGRIYAPSSTTRGPLAPGTTWITVSKDEIPYDARLFFTAPSGR